MQIAPCWCHVCVLTPKFYFASSATTTADFSTTSHNCNSHEPFVVQSKHMIKTSTQTLQQTSIKLKCDYNNQEEDIDESVEDVANNQVYIVT